MEAGWVVTEVGRQPWIVRNYMKVTQAATGNEGVWVMFVAIIALYIGVGVTLVLILRAMGRRWRGAPELAEHEVPYGPREPVAVGSGDGGEAS
jgi:cytochrome d ubiquinol oxidase subunit I